MPVVRVLLVEDSAADAQITSDMLAFARAPRCELTRVARLSEAHALLAVQRFAVILLDLGLPDADGIAGLRALRGAAPEAAIVVLSGLGGEAIAVEALESGAQDYLVKGRADADGLQRSIRFAIARREADVAQRRYAALVESSEDAILTKDLEATITSWNAGAERLYGYTRDEAVGRPLAMLVPDEHRGEEHELLARVLAGERIDHYETTRVCKDGTTKIVSLSIAAIRDDIGAVIAVSAIARDITERTRAAASLRAAEERFRVAFEKAPIGMALIDLEGHFTRVNEALCVITGYASEQLEGMSHDAFTHPDDVQGERAALATMRAGEQTLHSTEKRYIHASGHPVSVALQTTLIRHEGAPRHFLLQVQDITDRKRYEDKLQDLADHDSLTGLLNRRSFGRALNSHAALTGRYGAEGALLLLDLDHFKYVNDTFGHQRGDEVIVRAAELLRERLRESDVLARLGGDEFAVMLPKADADRANVVAQDLLQALRDEPIGLPRNLARSMTASIGIASFDADLSGEDVLVNADLAMYDAKEAGRDRVAHFSTEQYGQSRMKGRISWAQRIQQALDEDGFSLLAQPIVDFSTGCVSQYELLLRMSDNHGDPIPPGVFLYIAERLDMVQQIDAWVITNAIRLLADNHGAGEGVAIEINISGRSIGDHKLLELIDHEIRSSGVAPERLIFEVTETAAIEHIAKARRFAEHLAELGCRFALDDFGAGFGSFYYLKHLPFDFLKIDGEFIAHCASSNTDRLVIQAVVGIARGLAKATIAEFVGDDETVRLLTRLGVDYGQGYHLGRPAPVSDLFPAWPSTHPRNPHEGSALL